MWRKVNIEQESKSSGSFRGEIIKGHLITVAAKMFSEKVNLFKTVSLSHLNFLWPWISWLGSIHGMTTREYICERVENVIYKKNFWWKNLKCITNDTGKSDKNKGAVALVSKAVEDDGDSKLLVLRCIDY